MQHFRYVFVFPDSVGQQNVHLGVFWTPCLLNGQICMLYFQIVVYTLVSPFLFGSIPTPSPHLPLICPLGLGLILCNWKQVDASHWHAQYNFASFDDVGTFYLIPGKEHSPVIASIKSIKTQSATFNFTVSGVQPRPTQSASRHLEVISENEFRVRIGWLSASKFNKF